MYVAFIILGIALAVVAVIFVVFAVAEGSTIGLGIAVVFAAVSVAGVWTGWRHENILFHAKHDAILSDYRRQGFKLAYEDVNARGGWAFHGTEGDITAGRCVIYTVARRVDGVWRAGIPTVKGDGLVILDAARVKLLAAACK